MENLLFIILLILFAVLYFSGVQTVIPLLLMIPVTVYKYIRKYVSSNK
jgi:hypothetical protein